MRTEKKKHPMESLSDINASMEKRNNVKRKEQTAYSENKE